MRSIRTELAMLWLPFPIVGPWLRTVLGEPGNEKECKSAFHAEEGACVFKYGPDSAQAPAAPRPKRMQPSTEISPIWRPARVDTQLEG